jgi:DMSO reductase anchor subunit
MKPALSIILFTTIGGAAQGIAVVAAVATLAARAPHGAMPLLLWTATAMLVVALIASFFHLGHPLRAWRAALMWRTSWMSREVIALPAFIALIAAWASLSTFGRLDSGVSNVLAVLTIAGALLLWYCTAMIYACIRFIQEWAHPLTIVNYAMLGLASGLVASGALAMMAGEREFAGAIGGWALAATALAWVTRGLSLRRNATLKPKSTVQSATGIRSARVVQKSMGFTGGSFNTREFFHGASAQVFGIAKVGFQVLVFALPIVLLAWAVVSGELFAWLLALVLQAGGLLVERWFFFAQARHPQNIYYQVVS